MKRRTLLQIMGGGAASSLLPLQSFAQSGAGTAPHAAPVAAPTAITSEGASLNVGWRFHQGDIVTAPIRDQSTSYVAAKAGGSRGAAASNFNDSDWRAVDLPHDWAIEAPPLETENIAQGYRKRGYGWYRRAISLDPSLAGRYLEIQFGAIATNATVWFNGTPVAHNWSGYNGFSIDITAMATFGNKANVLAVRVDAETAEGWWYEGAGIYRDVKLVDRAPVSIITDGVHADPRRQTNGRWLIPVEVTLYSIERHPASVQVLSELIDADGRTVAVASSAGTANPLWATSVKTEITDIEPNLWSPERPNLYSVRTRILREGVVVDERITPCGFRMVRFDAQKGFFLNDVSVKIKGVCLHQDHAGLGIAVPPAIVDWRVRQVKEMGANAIRCSHGAPDVALLESCDRHGIMVMDENRNFNISPEYLDQLEWLVRRDRNRPSVVLWSVFNEEPLQGTPNGYEMVRRAVSAVKVLDDSRPVTAAMSAGLFTPVNVSQAVDVVGFNYQHASYDRFHAEHPDIPMLSSEDTSAFMTRGEWHTDKDGKIETSDDSRFASWGLSHRDSWKAVDSRAFIAGGFVWTGFDYHGEPTPYKWPANSSYFGILDLCGFRKSAFYLRRAMWVKDRPLLDILPHWNWDGREGQPVKVLVATNLDRVDLRLNGKLLVEGAPDPYEMISFEVPYQLGTLEARGWKNGRLVSTAKVETTGVPVRIRLTADRWDIAGDGVDALPVTIEVLDAKKRVVPTATLDIDLDVEGGRIIGLGNGNPLSLAPSKGRRVQLFNGLAQVIIQSNRNSSGKLVLSALSSGLAPDAVAFDIHQSTIKASLPPSFELAITQWRQSPVMRERPAVIPELADNDMNSWDATIAGEQPAAAAADGYVILASRATLTEAMINAGAILKFAAVLGTGEVLIDGAHCAEKSDIVAGPLIVNIPSGKRDITIALVLKATSGTPVGLTGPVSVEKKS